MSIEYMTNVWRSDLPRPEKLVCLAIADFVNDAGQGCFASYERLAYKTGYSRRNVIVIVDRLAAQGIIEHQGEHPDFGTNLWSINATKLPMLLPYKEWLKVNRGSSSAAKGRNTAHTAGATVAPGGEKATPSGEDSSLTGEGSASDGELSAAPIVKPSHHAGASSSPNPSYIRDIEPSEELSRQGRPGAPPASTKPFPPPQDKHPNPAQARAPGDSKIGRAPLDEELDEEARHRPQTALQDRVTRLCNARYLTDSMLAKLQSPLTVVRDGGPPQTYPSPEEEWQSNPGLFAEYVDLCARRIREESGRPPSRSDLIQTVRRYERRNTGWLDYKASRARARPRALPWYVTDPDTPSWMR